MISRQRYKQEQTYSISIDMKMFWEWKKFILECNKLLNHFDTEESSVKKFSPELEPDVIICYNCQ